MVLMALWLNGSLGRFNRHGLCLSFPFLRLSLYRTSPHFSSKCDEPTYLFRVFCFERARTGLVCKHHIRRVSSLSLHSSPQLWQ